MLLKKASSLTIGLSMILTESLEDKIGELGVVVGPVVAQVFWWMKDINGSSRDS